MISKQRIESIISRFERKVKKNINKRKINRAIDLLTVACSILYETNISYMSTWIEESINTIASFFNLQNRITQLDNECVFFYDSFGLDNRGIALIYIKALVRRKRIIYVTKNKDTAKASKIKDLVRENGGEYIVVNSAESVSIIRELLSIFEKYKPSFTFSYLSPKDVPAVICMTALFNTNVKRFLIDITDHAFWCGVNSFDKIIEFRDYGCYIDREYRHINSENILLLPYYPNIEKNISFEGFPFQNGYDKKVLFSGGSIYKTISSDKLYYKAIEEILRKYSDTVFWYAGNEKCEDFYNLEQIHPDRVFFSPERKDLFEILKHCFLYINTYPLVGGLMMQYAASAAKIPFTLKYDDCIDGFLINQEELGIIANTYDEFIEKISFALESDEYRTKIENILPSSVPSPNEFVSQVDNILDFGITDNVPKFRKVNVENFLGNYLERFSSAKLYMLFPHNRKFSSIIEFPLEWFIGILLLLKRKIRRSIE